jgi:hypothetical protein
MVRHARSGATAALRGVSGAMTRDGGTRDMIVAALILATIALMAGSRPSGLRSGQRR